MNPFVKYIFPILFFLFAFSGKLFSQQYEHQERNDIHNHAKPTEMAKEMGKQSKRQKKAYKKELKKSRRKRDKSDRRKQRNIVPKIETKRAN